MSKHGKSKNIGTIPHCEGRNSSSTLTFSFFVFFRVGAVLTLFFSLFFQGANISDILTFQSRFTYQLKLRNFWGLLNMFIYALLSPKCRKFTCFFGSLICLPWVPIRSLFLSYQFQEQWTETKFQNGPEKEVIPKLHLRTIVLS